MGSPFQYFGKEGEKLNYGVLKLNKDDESFSKFAPYYRSNSLVRLGGALAPSSISTASHNGASFSVDLYYNESSFFVASGVGKPIKAQTISYSKSFKRLASGGNPLADAKRFVAQIAGCDEAKKLRGRVIALSRIKKTIYGQDFRFRLGEP